MALTVSSDLSVSITTDQNVNKLTDIQEVLKKRIQKGEPKSMGISQVMLGFMIISYSVPLLSSEFTEVVMFGVPWWSGISFVIAGTVALIMEKHNSISWVFICMVLTLFTAVISIIAIIIYMVDIVKHPQTTCQSNTMPKCGVEYQLTRLNVEVKSILMSLSMVQTGIASAFGLILYRERQYFNNYCTTL